MIGSHCVVDMQHHRCLAMPGTVFMPAVAKKRDQVLGQENAERIDGGTVLQAWPGCKNSRPCETEQRCVST